MRYPFVDKAGFHWSLWEVCRHIFFQWVLVGILILILLFIALRSWPWALLAAFITWVCGRERKHQLASMEWRKYQSAIRGWRRL